MAMCSNGSSHFENSGASISISNSRIIVTAVGVVTVVGVMVAAIIVAYATTNTAKQRLL